MDQQHHEQVEEQAAKARGKRQNKQTPLLIREDGLLMPNVPLIAKKGNYFPYHGNPKASLKERLEYVANIGKGARRKVVYQQQEAFDLGKADADDIVAFAWEEYGVTLDGTMPLNALRKLCFDVSNMSDAELNAYRLGKRPAPPEAQPSAAGLGLQVPTVGDITAPPKPAEEPKTPRARGGGKGRAGATAEA